MTQFVNMDQVLQENTEWLRDIINTNDISEMTDKDAMREYIEDRVREYEVIYYNRAIKILQENDPSLRESLSLASDYGFTLDSDRLNSETLATILVQNYALEEIDAFLDNLEESDEEESK